MDKPHQVPLSDAAIATEPSAARSTRRQRGSNRDVTVHGFRASFRDWCGDETTFPREIAALAHAVTGVEGAYRRGSALEKRRELTAQWAEYCVGEPRGQLIGLRA
jgi:hypothetical protein